MNTPNKSKKKKVNTKAKQITNQFRQDEPT